MTDVRDEHERDTAQRDLRARANHLVLVGFGALICAPVGLYVIYAALREALRARSLGIPSHPSLRTAVLLAMMLRDHGTYLIDPSGRVPYQRCNAEYPQNGGITYRSQPIEPALVHEPTAIDSVLDAPTAGSYWHELEHWIEWGDVPCGAVEEGPDALPNP